MTQMLWKQNWIKGKAKQRNRLLIKAILIKDFKDDYWGKELEWRRKRCAKLWKIAGEGIHVPSGRCQARRSLVMRRRTMVKNTKPSEFDWSNEDFKAKGHSYPHILGQSFCPPYLAFHVGCKHFHLDFIRLKAPWLARPKISQNYFPAKFIRNISLSAFGSVDCWYKWNTALVETFVSAQDWP